MLKDIGEKAVIASKEINQLNSDVKNNLINDMSEQLIKDTDLILKANNTSYTIISSFYIDYRF